MWIACSNAAELFMYFTLWLQCFTLITVVRFYLMCSLTFWWWKAYALIFMFPCTVPHSYVTQHVFSWHSIVKNVILYKCVWYMLGLGVDSTLNQFRNAVQASVILRQGYVPEKHCANQTQHSHLKRCVSGGLGNWQPHPI
jgi:hypothetical protein